MRRLNLQFVCANSFYEKTHFVSIMLFKFTTPETLVSFDTLLLIKLVNLLVHYAFNFIALHSAGEIIHHISMSHHSYLAANF